MSDKTKIEWTDATWNVITGCSIVSAGCTNCYAMKLAGTRLKHHPTREGLTDMKKAGPVWNGQVRFNERALTDPLKWTRPRRIFVCAHGDLGHENVPFEWLDKVFVVMALSPHHTHQVLTKRPDRLKQYLAQAEGRIREGVRVNRMRNDKLGRPEEPIAWPLPNVWLGVSVEDQKTADARIPLLLATPAAIRFVSAEPLLGSVDLTQVRRFNDAPAEHINALASKVWTDQSGLPNPDPTWAYPGHYYMNADGSEDRTCKINWVIVGGENGPRPMHPDWARSLRDQCAAAGVPYFFKQWGTWEPALDRDRDDPDCRKDYTNDYVDYGKSKWLNLDGGSGFHGERFHVMRNVGKKAAGDLLDGVQHHNWPEVA